MLASIYIFLIVLWFCVLYETNYESTMCGFCSASLDRMQIEQIGIGQLHWSTANYAPLQERALWDGLVAMYDKVTLVAFYTKMTISTEWPYSKRWVPAM